MDLRNEGGGADRSRALCVHWWAGDDFLSCMHVVNGVLIGSYSVPTRSRRYSWGDRSSGAKGSKALHRRSLSRKKRKPQSTENRGRTQKRRERRDSRRRGNVVSKRVYLGVASALIGVGSWLGVRESALCSA
jgi:hypothetical protein